MECDIMKDRDMYYGGYGYSGFAPMPSVNNQIPGMLPNQYGSGNSSNSYFTSQFNDINERIERVERQIKRLDQRLTRLETPYANSNNNLYNNEPDNNMYMM
jgi:septation ring formation regulator EzrA